MKKLILLSLFLVMLSGIALAADLGNYIQFQFANGRNVYMNSTSGYLDGLNLSCNNVITDSGDPCNPGGAGSVDYSKVQNYSNSSCPAGYYPYNRLQNGTFLCRVDLTGSGTFNPDNVTLVKSGAQDVVNETWINSTIEQVANYTGGSNITVSSNKVISWSSAWVSSIFLTMSNYFTDRVNIAMRNESNNFTQNQTFNKDIRVTEDAYIENILYVGKPCTNAIEGEGCFSGRGRFNQSVLTWAQEYGTGFSVSDYGTVGSVQFRLSGNSTFNATTGIFCDNDNPFAAGDVGNIINVITSSPENIPFTIDIESVINSTCVRLNTGIFGTDVVPDLNTIKYVTSIKPIILVLDNGIIINNLGNSEGSSFTIRGTNVSGSDKFYISMTSGADNLHDAHISNNVNGFGGGINLHLTTSSSENITGETDTLVIEPNLDNFVDGVYKASSYTLVAGGNGTETTVISLDGAWDYIIKEGTAETLNKSYYYNGTNTTNVTAAFSNKNIDVPILEAVNSFISLRNEINFTRISVSLNTVSSKDLEIQVYYCNTTQQYTLIPTISDTTAGFTQSGIISFTNPVNRGKCSIDLNNNSYEDGANLSTIIIQRTKVNVNILPIEDLISIFSDTPSFFLMDDALKLKCVASPPVTCNAGNQGTDYCDSASNSKKFCDGTDWVTVGGAPADTSAATECSGATTYYSGEGACNDLSLVYLGIADQRYNESGRVDSLNITVRNIVNANCSGTNKATGRYANGTIICSADITNSTADMIAAVNNTFTYSFKVLSQNVIGLADSVNVTTSFGGDVSGTYNAIVITKNYNTSQEIWDNVFNSTLTTDTELNDANASMKIYVDQQNAVQLTNYTAANHTAVYLTNGAELYGNSTCTWLLFGGGGIKIGTGC